MIKKNIKNKKNFNNIIENIQLLICRFNPETGIITFVNDAYCNYFNKSNLDLIGKNILKLIPKKEYKNVLKHFKSLNKNNPFMSYEHIIYTPKGLRWQKWTDQILFDDNDQIIEYQLICEDITKHKKIEEKNLLMNYIIQQIYESIIIVDIDFNITYVNLSALELYGYNKDELIGKPLNILYAEALPKEVKKDIHNKITPGKAWIVIHKNKKKDGSTFLCEFKFSPICDNNSKIYAYAAIQRDITEQKKAEEKMIQRLKFEETISKISSRFIGKYDIDDSINYSLMNIGKLCNASRAYLFLLKENKKIMDNTHEWCSDRVSPQINNLKNISCDMFPWWMKKLENNEIILITDVSKLPIEAINEKQILEDQDIKSLIVLPLYINKNLSGFIGFDNVVKTGEWNTTDLSILRVASEIIGNALENKIYRDKLINK